MSTVDGLLEGAGAEWRAGQPPTPAVDLNRLVAGTAAGRRRRRGFRWATLVAAATSVVVLATALAMKPAGLSGTTSGVASPGASPTPSLGVCVPTRPQPAYVPAHAPETPPAQYRASWYGTAHLWTMLGNGGEVWAGWVRAQPPVLPQKTFWWSDDWATARELQPAITVTGRRLDGDGSFTFGPGTNASADFGTAMLVGIDIPSFGCWEITARYRQSSLSYVVEVSP
jgi:hypothetical protein